MTVGGNSSQQNSQSQQQSQNAGASYYDPTETGLLNSRVGSANDFVNGTGAYVPYSGAPLSIDSTAAQGASTFSPSTVSAGLLSSTSLTPYENPFQQDVINSSLNTLDQQQQQSDQQVAGDATQQGAFGGDRAAVAQGINDQNWNLQKASTVAGLNSQNFTQAQGAAQSDIATQLAAATQNQNSGIAGAGVRLAGGAQLSSDQQATYNAAYQKYLNSQQDPLALQTFLNSTYGLLPQSPLSVSAGSSSGSSTGTGSSAGFNLGIPKAA